MRMRLSCTTGNLVQLLMRCELNFNFMERRSMKSFGSTNDFHRILAEEFFDVPWRSTDAAYD
eukprot:3296814-Heterocapsa_arctica.AAC.1